MTSEAQYGGAAVLSHVEAVYRPGERDLAIALFEAMGCTTHETDTFSPSGSAYISVHPDANDRGLDNVIYLSEMPAQQAGLEAVLTAKIAQDADLGAARDNYRGMAGTQPYGLSHIAVRYPSFDSLERVLEGIEGRLEEKFASRVIVKVFRPGDMDDHAIDSVQAFVYTDIAVAGISAFGQVFELAAYEL